MGGDSYTYLKPAAKNLTVSGIMPTYGKRKKGLLSSFTVFQDDKPEQDPNQQRSGE